MPAVFSYDAQTGPQYVDLNGIAAGYGIISVPVTGFLTGDQVQTVGLTISGTGLTTIALAVDMVQRTGGYYEWTDASSIDAHFTITRAQITAIAAVADCKYSVVIMILRNGVQQLREVQTGAISARTALPAPPLIVNEVVLTGGPVSGSIGQTAQLTATCYDGLGNVLPLATVTWTSSNTNVATVDATGQVTFVLPGNATITATSEGVAATTSASTHDGSFLSPTNKQVAAYDVGSTSWLPTTLTAAYLSLTVGALAVGGGWPAGATELLPGAAGGYVRSNGSAYVRVSGVAAGDVAAGTFGAGAYTFPLSLTVTNGLTVQAGTSALQAVTATTIVASSTISGPLVNPLTFGTHLTGSSYNNAAGVTLGTDATNLNTASTIVARDGSGNFSAGIVTATLSGAAPAGSLSGTTLAANVVSSSLTTVGVLASPHMTGAVVDSGGFTVTAGTAALQALTATTGAFSSTLGVTGLATFSSTILTPYTSGVAKTIWKAQDATGGSTKGPFQLIIGGSLFASTIDNTMYFGYNLADGGGNTVSTEPAFGFVIEQDYQVASTHFVESYFEWHDIGGSLGKRPIFWQFNRATGSLVSMNVRSNGMSFTEWDDATEPVFATLNRAGFILNGYATQTSDTQLVVSAQNGKFGALSLGGGFLIQANGSSARWTLGLGGRVPIEMTSNQVIVGGNGNFGGTLIVETPSTRVTNDHTLFLRAATSQTTNLLKAVASDGTTQVAALTTAGALTLASTLTVSAGGMTVSSGTSALQAVTATTITASGLVAANAGVTVASGQTLTLTGTTVAGTPTWSSSQAITVSTAAQPNITSVGTLTSLSVSGAGTFGTGLTVTTGGMTVSGGTAAVQALTATTGVFSSTVSSSGFTGPLTGNASTATALATARTIAITGDLAYTSPAFDGSGNVTAAGTLATVNANVGAFGSSTAIPVVTVNAKGLVTAVSTAAVVAPAGTLTGTTLAANVVTSSLTTVGVLASPHLTSATVDSGGLTVTAGTTAVQALTATTATLSGLGTFNAGATIASAQTLTLTGATVAGAPTWSSSQAITLSTAAQPNITSLGTLTSITTSGALTMTATASKIVPGATSFAVRNTADSANNLLITDAGAVTVRLSLTTPALTVSSGASSLQATTATTVVTSSSITVQADGIIVTAGGLTVSAGTTAVQALTATSGAFSSNVIVTGYVQVGTSAPPTGAIGGSATVGLAIVGRTGSVYDFAVFDPTGNNYVIANSTGTRDVLVGGALTIGGVLKFGVAYIAGAPAATGYITAKDSTGATYKLLAGT